MNRQERTEFIYVLLDGKQRIFYCGRSRDINKRLKEHIDEAMAGGQSAKCRHVRHLIEQGDVITTKQIDEAPSSKIAELEAWWIDKLDCNADFGYVINLMNGNAGSQGPQIDEVQLRNDIQEFRRKKKKRPTKPFERMGPPPTPEEQARIKWLCENDRPQFDRELRARRELRREQEMARKQWESTG